MNHSNDDFDHLPVYDVGMPVEDPQVNMMLALQMEFLSELALDLGRTPESEMWSKRSDKLIKDLIARSWNGEKFIFYRSGTDDFQEDADGIYNYTMMLLGERLPKEIRTRLVRNFLESGILSDFGARNESIRSPRFNPDTYTRGAIWPPNNLFVYEGLKACGAKEEAEKFRLQFIHQLEKNGFSERFHPLTGAPLSDPCYTWTSSVYMILEYSH